MNASAIIENLTASGVTIQSQHGQLIVTPANRLTDDQRTAIKAHKSELLALLAANDTEPVKTYRLFLVTRPDGTVLSVSRSPACTLADIQADHPGATIEPFNEPKTGLVLSSADLALANRLLDHWDEHDEDTRREWLDGLSDPARLAQMRQQAIAAGLTVAAPRYQP